MARGGASSLERLARMQCEVQVLSGPASGVTQAAPHEFAESRSRIQQPLHCGLSFTVVPPPCCCTPLPGAPTSAPHVFTACEEEPCVALLGEGLEEAGCRRNRGSCLEPQLPPL